MFARNNALNDRTWRSVTLMTWTDVESSVYLIAACIPSLRPLIRTLAHQQVFKKHYWSNGTNPTSAEHARPRSSARVAFSGADGFKRLVGGCDDISEAELGHHSVHAVSRGVGTPDERLELEQVTADGRIRVTNAVQVEFESNKAFMHGQDTANV